VSERIRKRRMSVNAGGDKSVREVSHGPGEGKRLLKGVKNP